MPNRMIREGIVDSPKVEMLVREGGWGAEVFYRRLLQTVDDYGCCDGRLSMIKAKCYPTVLDLVKDADVEKWVELCEKCHLVEVYHAGGLRYLRISNFRQIIRMKPKFPLPPGVNAEELKAAQADPGSGAFIPSTGPRKKKKKANQVEDTSEVVYVMPVVGAAGPREWPVTKNRIAEYAQVYPGIDLDRQFRKMLLWLNDNPARRKTFGGMPKFVIGWLNREQNDNRGHSNSGRVGAVNGEEQRRKAIDAGIDEFTNGKPGRIA